MSSVTTEPSLSTAWLRVTDDMMQQAGLQKGSLVELEPPTDFVEPGQAAALRLTSGRTVVRFIDSYTADCIIVRAANHDSQPERIRKGDVLHMARIIEVRTIFM